MNTSKKEICKKQVLKILKELANAVDEAEKNGISVYDFESELKFKRANIFYTKLSEINGISESTYRDAISELEKEGLISREEHGFYELTTSSDIGKIVKKELFVTILPLQHETEGICYMEVSDNAAPFLADLFNKSTSRNDKRFYSIAHNLLLMLDLKIPAGYDYVAKKPFDLRRFIKGYGISLRDYDTLCSPIEGYSLDEMISLDAQKPEDKEYNGKITKPRDKKPKRRILTESDTI